MRFPLLAFAGVSILVLATGAVEHAVHWSYSGEGGPTHWGALDKHYTACARGKAQSPVDIRTGNVRGSKLPPIRFEYRKAPLRITDNGHSIQVDYPPGSRMSVGGKVYELVQFHFHHPAEERIDGRSAEMDVHLVHRDSAGHLAVIAVPVEAGAESKLIATLWHNLPATQGHADTPAGVTIDAAELLPTVLDYYSYTGSLTTPPCTEGVRWFVLKHGAAFSPAEIQRFAALYPLDARPVQPLYGRQVLSSR